MSGKPNGTGISDIAVTLKEKGNNFLIGATCEMRFFELNDQSIDLSELDDRYARKDHTHPEFTELQGDIDEVKDFLETLEVPEFGGEPEEGAFDYRRTVGWFYCLETMSRAPSNNFYLYNDGTGDVTTATHFDINRGLMLVDGSADGFTEWDEKLEQGEWLNFFLPGEDSYSGSDQYIDVQVGPYVEKIAGGNGFDAFRFEVMSARATPLVATLNPLDGRINEDYGKVKMNYGLVPSAFVTPDQLNASIDGVIELSKNGDTKLQNQIDFMAQEINHLLPLKTQASWDTSAGYRSPGVVKFNSTARYGPWDDEIDSIYFNRIDKSGVNHSEMFEDLQAGDKLEVFISKHNYCLFEATRSPSISSDDYVIAYVKPVKYEGEGYVMYDTLEFEFFEREDKKPANLDGWFSYTLGKIADQITKDNIHEHPGRFICVDGNGAVVDNQYSTLIKFVYFAPVDGYGDRPPVSETASDSFRLKVFEIRTRALTRNGNITPSFFYAPKTDSKPFYVGSHYNQAAQTIPAIKINADENWTASYENMGSAGYPQYWRWPI